MTKEIPVSGGKYVALVDDADYEALARHRWFYAHGYAIRHDGPRANRRTVRMHREIMGADDSEVVDHANHNRLDNRRTNLRKTNQTLNVANIGTLKPNASGFKGVSKQRGGRNWRAIITAHGKDYRLGLFATAVDAAYAYDAKARELFGPFAVTNFPEPPPPNYKPAPLPLTMCRCKICGRTWESGYRNRTICSETCRAEDHRARQRRLKARRADARHDAP